MLFTVKRRDQLLRAPVTSSMARPGSIRVDDGRKGRSLLAQKMPSKAGTAVGRREKSLLCDPGSESLLLSVGRRQKRRVQIFWR